MSPLPRWTQSITSISTQLFRLLLIPQNIKRKRSSIGEHVRSSKHEFASNSTYNHRGRPYASVASQHDIGPSPPPGIGISGDRSRQSVGDWANRRYVRSDWARAVASLLY